MKQSIGRTLFSRPLLQDAGINAALKQKLDKTPGARAWGHLPPLLGQDLLRDQARLFLDDDRRSGSLTNLWRKLGADPAIRAHFHSAYVRMLDELHMDQIDEAPVESAAMVIERFKQQGAGRAEPAPWLGRSGWPGRAGDPCGRHRPPASVRAPPIRPGYVAFHWAGRTPGLGGGVRAAASLPACLGSEPPWPSLHSTIVALPRGITATTSPWQPAIVPRRGEPRILAITISARTHVIAEPTRRD